MADAPDRHDPIHGKIIHVYDGIEEADNQLPRWWVATSLSAVLFAVGYWFYFHTFGVGQLPMEAYAEEMAAAAAKGGEVTPEMLDALAQSPAEVAEGGALFVTHCAVCHGAQAEGNIGPNLTDVAWIHGGDPMSIYATITDGVGAKGMPAWGATLGAQSVQRLTAYAISLRGTNVPGKEPQGEPWSPGAEAPAPAEAAPAGDAAAAGDAGVTAPGGAS
jgi:cytochrome c oxidase cbb3-type subunit 3